MTPADWSTAATVLGFIGSLMLFYPGWRASRSLQHIERIRALIGTAKSTSGPVNAEPETREAGQTRPVSAQEPAAEQLVITGDPGPELLQLMEEQHHAWSGVEHGLLMAGVILISLSFAAELFLVKLVS